LSNTFVGVLLPAIEQFWKLDLSFFQTMQKAFDSAKVGNQTAVVDVSKETKQRLLELARGTVGIPGETYQGIIRDLAAYRKDLIARRESLTQVIRREVAAHPDGEILLTFPHIGEIAAATIIGIVKDIGRWPNKKTLRKAMGVYNSLTQSGSGSGRGRRGKEGSRHGRRVLFQVCFGCVRTNAPENDFRDYYQRRITGGRPRIKALVDTMGKLAEVIYHCLKTREPYEYHGVYRVGWHSSARRQENSTTDRPADEE
jgi:hypothetical protein